MKNSSIMVIDSSIQELQKQKFALISADMVNQLKTDYGAFPELLELLDTLIILSDERFIYGGLLHRMKFTLGKGVVTELCWLSGNGDDYSFFWIISEKEEKILQYSNSRGEVQIDKLLWCQLAEKLKISITPTYAFAGLMSRIVCFDQSIYREYYLDYFNDWEAKEAKLPINKYAKKLINADIFKTAAEQGDIIALKPLLDDFSEDSTADKRNVLALAVQHGHPEIVRSLLKDPHIAGLRESRDAEKLANQIFFKSAAKKGDLIGLKPLLDDFSHDATADKSEALILAAEQGYIDIVKAILQDSLIDSFVKAKALKVAVRNKDPVVVIELLKCPNIEVMEAFFTAIRAGQATNAKLLTECSHFNSAYNWYDLLFSIVDMTSQDYMNCIKILLKNKEKMVTDKNTIIAQAVKCRNLPVVELLLQDGRFDPGVENNVALRYAAIQAARSGDCAILKALLQDARVDPTDLRKHSIASLLPPLDRNQANIQIVDELIGFSTQT